METTKSFVIRKDCLNHVSRQHLEGLLFMDLGGRVIKWQDFIGPRTVVVPGDIKIF